MKRWPGTPEDLSMLIVDRKARMILTPRITMLVMTKSDEEAHGEEDKEGDEDKCALMI